MVVATVELDPCSGNLGGSLSCHSLSQPTLRESERPLPGEVNTPSMKARPVLRHQEGSRSKDQDRDALLRHLCRRVPWSYESIVQNYENYPAAV